MTGPRYAAAVAPEVLQRWHGLLLDCRDEPERIETVRDEIADALDIATGWAVAAHAADIQTTTERTSP